MAARKQTVEKQAEEKAVNLQPTRDDIWEAVKWVSTHTNLVPTLWGPTAVGKTYGADQFAKNLGAELVTVLLQQHTPDEIAGFQVQVGDKLVAQEPYWFARAQEILDRNKSVVLLFDELGLARDEVRGALYTFFRDRHIHNNYLKPKGKNKVYVIAATNPAPLAAPFLTRTTLFHVPADRSYMLGIAKKASIAYRVAEIAPLSMKQGDSAFVEQQPPLPKVVTAAAIDALNRLDSEFWNMSDAAQRMVLGSLVPGETLEEVFRDKQDITALIRDPKTLCEQLIELDAPDAVTLALAVLEGLDNVDAKERSEALAELLHGLWSDINFKLKPYYEAEKSQRMLDAAQGIDAEYMVEYLTKNNYLMEQSGGIAGILVDSFIEQKKASGDSD